MVSLKDLWLVPAFLLILAAAAFVGFPLYLHAEIAQSTGAFAPLYLYQYSPYDTIAVEVHYEPGAAPSEDALAALRQMLATYTGKRVEVAAYGDLPEDTINGSVSEDNVSDVGAGIVDQYARTRMGWISGTIPIYILYVNGQGPAARTGANDTVVGVSYDADSFIVLKDNIDGEALEKSVLIHETGHLFGLDHDNDTGCVMSAVMLENASWKNGGGPPADFCAAHKKELSDRRADPFYSAGKVLVGDGI